jgi:hypothetical protein
VWKYAYNSRTDDLNIDTSGIAGQNMSTPRAKLFAQHWIVHRTGDATYYDPSYGTTTTGAQDYTAQAVDAWRSSASGRWAKATSLPGATLVFTDLGW